MVCMVKNVYVNVRGSKDELFILASIVGNLRNDHSSSKLFDHGRTICWMNFFEVPFGNVFGVSA